MVHGELSLADQFARLKVKFKKYVGSTVFVSLQLFFQFFFGTRPYPIFITKNGNSRCRHTNPLGQAER